jgi:hypothetical protein
MKYILILFAGAFLYSCGESQPKKDSEKNVELTDHENINEFGIYFQQLQSFIIKNHSFCEEIDTVISKSNPFTVSGNSGNYLSVMTVDSLYLKGDVTQDGIEDIILKVTNEGGGCGGNIGLTEYYIIEGNGAIKEIYSLGTNSIEPIGNYSISIESIEDGKMKGYIYVEREGSSLARVDRKFEKIPCLFSYNPNIAYVNITL